MVGLRCRYCKSETVVKYGKYGDTQLLFCKVCRRKFKALDSPFHMKIPSDVVAVALEMHYSGKRLKHIRDHLKEEFGYRPSKPVLYYWIEKFTDLARGHFKCYQPVTGDSWILDETVVAVEGRHDVWIYDVIDEKTRFLLATRASPECSISDAGNVLEEALSRARAQPFKVVIRKSYEISGDIGRVIPSHIDYEVRQSSINDLNDFELIARFSGILPNGNRAIRSFRNTRVLIRYVTGWWVYYNFFKPNPFIGGETPAEAAGINYGIKSWPDFVRFQYKRMDSTG